MLVREAAAAIGIEEPDDRDVCVTVFVDGKPRNAPLRRAGRMDMSTLGDVYVASGLFERDSIRPDKGRSWGNVREVMWLAFDADLSDFLGMDTDVLHDMDGDVLDGLVETLATEVRSVFKVMPLPLHRLDATGYGLCAYVMLDRADRDRLDEIKALYPLLLRALNERAGMPLFDRQVSDAGTRFTRLPGCVNTKGRQPRPNRTLLTLPGTIGVNGLGVLVGGALQRRVDSTRQQVAGTQQLSPEQMGRIVDAIAPEWTHGRRHAVSLGVAGMLCKAGVTEDGAEAVIRAIAERAGDEEEWSRLVNVRTTYAAHRGGRDVRGYHALLAECAPATVAEVDGVLEPLRRATAPTIRLGSTIYNGEGVTTGSRPACVEPPDAAWRGWIGEYRELVEQTTEAADAFHLGTALAVAGVSLGKRVRGRYAGGTVYGNLYCLLIGSAGGSRKDTAMSRGSNWPRIMEAGGFMGPHTEPPFHLFRDAGSAQALIDVMDEHNESLLYLSEFARLTRNARRQGTSDLVPVMLNLFDVPEVIESVTRGKPARVERPFMSMLAAIQPDVLSMEFGEQDTASGLTSRFLYFVGEGKDEPLPDPPPPDGPRLAALYRRLLDVREQGAELRIDPAAVETWDEFYLKDKRRQVRGLTQDTMRTRLAPLVRRVALIYAATEGDTAIRAEHLTAAIQVIEWQWDAVCRLSMDWGASVGDAINHRVVEVLSQHGPMSHAQLFRLTKSPRWGPEQFDSVTRAMLNIGEIIKDGAGTVALGPEVR